MLLVLEVRYIQGGPTVYPLVTYLAFVLSSTRGIYVPYRLGLLPS